MDKLSDRLLDAGATPAGHGSKLARVLGTTPKDPPATDPLHRAVAEQLDELLVWDRAVRAEADDAVHQMRVTTRRMRSLLQASPDSFALPEDNSDPRRAARAGEYLGGGSRRRSIGQALPQRPRRIAA